jgi:hypothetical protein
MVRGMIRVSILRPFLSIVLAGTLGVVLHGCDTEEDAAAPGVDAAIVSTGNADADANPKLDGGSITMPPADAIIASGCVPNVSTGPVLDGTGTADVSFMDRIDTNADTNNFFGRQVIATLTSSSEQPQHTLNVTIGFSTDTGLRWLKLKVVDKTVGGIQAGVIYPFKSAADAIAAQQFATAEYSETRCQYGWETNGTKGSVQISRLQGNLIDLFVGDASFIPGAVDHGQKGSFTIRANIKDLTAKTATL